MAVKQGGSVSASLLILILVAGVIGAIVALVLQDSGLGPRIVAIVAGFLATIVASIARYKIVFLGAGRGPDESRIPVLVVTYAAIASVAGSLAAHDIHLILDGNIITPLLGALAGAFSAILMAMLMLTYHRHSGTTLN